MRPELSGIAGRNGGVFTRRDAIACGYTERELKTLTGQHGGWVVVRRGAYVERALWEASNDDDRYLFLVRASALAMRTDAVVSHASAAAVLGMPIRPRWRRLAHVTRSGARGGRTENGVKHHLADLGPQDTTIVDGIRVTGLIRTGLDIARESGFEDGVVACDAALRLGASADDFGRDLRAMRHWPNIGRARAAAAVADGGAQTIGETLMRLLVLELRIGIPQTQFVVVEGSRRAEVDARVGRHLFEFDGRIKYVGRERGGVADKPAEQILWDEKRREDWLRRVHGGYGMSRVIWDDLFGPARRRTLRRLAAEYDATLRRFGAAA